MTTPPIGRRAQNRLDRHQQLMAAATEIISETGSDGLTMQAVADRVDCAVGTIYTYFPSKTALLGELQISAIDTLKASFELSSGVWDEELAAARVDETVASLVRLVAFGHLFTAGPILHPREFELLQMLLSTRRRGVPSDEGRPVLPHAFELISEFLLLIDRAVDVGVLTTQGDAFELSLSRTLRWAGGLNGALLVSNTSPDAQMLTVDQLDGRMLALQLADDLLRGWGAPPLTLATANDFVADLGTRGRLLKASIAPLSMSQTAAD